MDLYCATKPKSRSAENPFPTGVSKQGAKREMSNSEFAPDGKKYKEELEELSTLGF